MIYNNEAKVRGMMRRRESFQKDGPRKSRAEKDFRLNLNSITQRIAVHFQRPENLYAVPGDPNAAATAWLEGAGHFVKVPKHPKGTYIHHNYGPEGCLICAYTDPEAYGLSVTPTILKWQELFKNFRANQYWSMGGWIEEWHHVIPDSYTDKEGKVRDTVVRRLCGNDCPHCEDRTPRVFGKKFYMDFTYTQWYGPIEAAIEELSRIPKDGGYIFPVYYTCESCQNGPLEFTEVIRDDKGNAKEKRDVTLNLTDGCRFCGSKSLTINDFYKEEAGRPPPHTCMCDDCGKIWPLLSHASETMLGRVTRRQTCKKCGHVGYPQLILEHSEGLSNWETRDIFDVGMHFSAQGDTVQNKRLVISDWVFREPDQRLFDLELQGDNAETWVKSFSEPMDLKALHRVPSPEEAADRLGVPNILDQGASAPDKKKFIPRGQFEE